MTHYDCKLELSFLLGGGGGGGCIIVKYWYIIFTGSRYLVEIVAIWFNY